MKKLFALFSMLMLSLSAHVNTRRELLSNDHYTA